MATVFPTSYKTPFVSNYSKQAQRWLRILLLRQSVRLYTSAYFSRNWFSWSLRWCQKTLRLSILPRWRLLEAILATFWSRWMSSRVSFVALCCVVAADYSRAAFILTACLAQDLFIQVLLNRFTPVPVSKTSATVIRILPMSIKFFRL